MVQNRLVSIQPWCWGLTLVAVVVLSGCSGKLSEPPLGLTYRDSLMGIGKILQISNLGEEALTELQIRIETPAGDVKNHTLSRLEAGELVELGWKKLDGFEIPVGAEVEVSCAGFLGSFRAQLKPEPAPSAGSS
ncbi:MAG: hypothetical protein K0U98_09005 [Deltaproteobacteria bacterium]|nr:hypothetical protein [Deltaproteobacteria bacterium]